MSFDGDQAPERPESPPAPTVGLLLSMLRHSHTDIVGVLDAEGRLRFGLPDRLLGYTLEQLFGELPIDYIHPDDANLAAETLMQLMAVPGLTDPVEVRVRHADGDWRWLEVVGENLLDDPDVRGLIFSGRDISARKQAQEAMRSADRLWRSLMHTSTEQISLLGADGTVLISTGVGQILGYVDFKPDNMGSALDMLHPDDVDKAHRNFENVMARPGTHPPLVTRARHADGRWRWVETFANNLLEDPDVCGVVVTTRDITDRVEAEASLLEETKALDAMHVIGTRLAAELDLDVLLQDVVDAATRAVGAIAGTFLANLNAAGQYRLSSGRDPVPDQSAAYVVTPVTSRFGDVMGGLMFAFDDPLQATSRVERLAAGIASSAAVAIDNARLYRAAQAEIEARGRVEAELAHQATHDPLTGLPNRTLVVDRLAQALARLGRGLPAVAVLLLDMDRFKVINDSLGHAVGDRVLVAAAERLQQAVRPGDTVARLGGDEFVVLCEGINGEIDAVGVADRIARAFDTPLEVGELQPWLSVSIGIAVSTDPRADPVGLLRDADAVMYTAKAMGRNRWEIFDEVLRARVVERLEVETELHGALAADQLNPYYQPVVALPDESVIGAEALVRWEHPTRGRVLPDGFIGVAEDSGLVVPIGERMISKVCRQLARWSHLGDFTISVNVSARQLVQSDLFGAVRAALRETAIDPARLCLEITESALLGDVDAAVRVVRAVRGLGVGIWVDDFGTGYSSLLYLRRLQVDGIKIDRSFVAGLTSEAEDHAIVAGTIDLAHNLGLKALAEGVETRAQADELAALGCDLAQGYLWLPPMSANGLEQWLAQPRASRSADRRTLPASSRTGSPTNS